MILLKECDVFECLPDPRQYFEMFARCGGEEPLNVFATVASLFSSGAGYEAQTSLEEELLAPSVKNRVRRFRKTIVGDRPSAVFTRATALLALKCLLAVEPVRKLSVTALGAIALHANDYVDMTLDEADAKLLMVQMMPVWEVHNPRDIGQLLRRYHYIFNEILAVDPRVITLFTDAIGVHPKDLRIDGLRVDNYLALLFGLFTIARKSATSLRTSIIDFSDPTSTLAITAEEITDFLKARSLDRTGFRRVIGPVATADEFAGLVKRSEWATDFLVFRNHPILALPNDRLLILDLQFLIENASAGLFWNTFQRFPKSARELLLSYWGEAFETYLGQVVTEHFGVPWKVLRNIPGHDFEIDILLTDGETAIVIEAKAGMLNQNVKTSREVSQVTRAIETKFVTNAKGKPKGIRQLARSCNARGSE